MHVPCRLAFSIVTWPASEMVAASETMQCRGNRKRIKSERVVRLMFDWNLRTINKRPVAGTRHKFIEIYVTGLI